MKTGELAKILSIDRETISNWIKNPLLSHFFTLGAKGEHGAAQRIFTESDVLVLNTIRAFRTSGKTDWGEIAAYLRSGQREQGFPQNAISSDPRTVPLPQAEQSARAMGTMAERNAALAKVRELENEVERLRSEYRDEITLMRNEHKEYVSQLLSDQKELMREISELNRQLGLLQGRLEARDEPHKD